MQRPLPGLQPPVPGMQPQFPGMQPSLPAIRPQLPGAQPQCSGMQSPVSSFWDVEQVRQQLRNLQDTINLAKALQQELEGLHLIRQSSKFNDAANDISSNHSLDLPQKISQLSEEKELNAQESLSLEAANSIMSALSDQLVPFNAIMSQTSSWEQKSMVVRLAQKLQKAKRNKHWKRKKRKHIAELMRKEREGYEKADKDADEWRAREIAKDIARRKVENMKAIAKLKAIEDRKRLESELELVLVVEKLQELRSIRIQKLKKQGHFLPEEDDKFLERVRAAVEEEERQAAAAADTDAAKGAIATAEVSRKTILGARSSDVNFNKGVESSNQEQFNKNQNKKVSDTDVNLGTDQQKPEKQVSASSNHYAHLPFEFYHYYHGSSNDMGTLIEVRRMWDAYIRPGGSRIPGHWIQPPPPADEVWASYLVRPN